MKILYEIQLSPGWYMNNTGHMHHYPTPGVPVYKLSEGLPVDLTETSKTMSSMQIMLPDLDDRTFVTDLKEFTLSDDTVKFLVAFGFVSGVAPAVMAWNAAVTVVDWIAEVLSGGSAAMEKKMESIRVELESFIKTESGLRFMTRISDLKDDLGKIINDIKSYSNEFLSVRADKETLKSRLQIILNSETVARDAAFIATAPVTWERILDLGQHSWSVSGPLYLGPLGAYEPKPVTLKHGQAFFDHQLAIPFILYGVHTYLQVLKLKFPEYRTRGKWREDLVELSRRVRILADNMLNKGLAYYMYEPEDFFLEDIISQIRPNRSFLGWDPVSYLTFYKFNVGAVDLASYSDSFLRSQPLNLGEFENARKYIAPVTRGELRIMWDSRMPLEDGSFISEGDYMYAAGEANSISEKAYKRLLASSGYLHLCQLACALAHLSTEPDSSETVQGKSYFFKSHQETKNTTALSMQIRIDQTIVSEQVTVPARIETQSAKIKTRISTQSMNRLEPVTYNIYLRSLNIKKLGPSAADPDYEYFYKTRYVEDESNAGFKRLQVEENPSVVKDQILLLKGQTPVDGVPVYKGGTWNVKLDTYDWYIPSEDKKPYREGISKIMPFKYRVNLGLVNDRSSIFKSFKMLQQERELLGFQKAITEFPDGQRRWLGEDNLKIDWSLEWEGDKLIVTVDSAATNRNCFMYLVVEELLPSNQSLHTWFPIPLNTQLTYVPKDFFQLETDALNNAVKEYIDKHKKPFGAPFSSATDFSPKRKFEERLELEKFLAIYEINNPDFVKAKLGEYPVFEIKQEQSIVKDQLETDRILKIKPGKNKPGKMDQHPMKIGD